jgi:broad specificity phosphatase PhoE
MIRRVLLCLALAVGLSLRAAAQGAPTVVVLVRHAEKGTTPASDPPLTEAGLVRAKALAAVLADAKIQAIVSTPFVRTRETARPTAEAHALPVEIVAVAGRPVAEHAMAVADAVRKHPGKTVLVVGHSNTIAPIIAALGGPKLRDLCDSEYSNLYTLVLEGKSATLIQSSYGVVSGEPASGCPNSMKQP